jgi:hypothetical protein
MAWIAWKINAYKIWRGISSKVSTWNAEDVMG